MGSPFSKLPQGHFGLIAADCPMKFKAGHSNRSTENHYPTMKLEAIKALPVWQLAAQDCVLMLWTSPPFLEQSMSIMYAWRFRYISVGFTWVKLTEAGDLFISLGHTTRKSTEMVLLGKRGKPPRLAKDVPEVILSKVREHSRKPKAFFSRCERLYAGPYLELFSRENRRGWSTWGNETGKFNRPAHSEV